MRCRGEDEAVLVAENFEPVRKIACVVVPRLELRNDAEKATAQIGHEFFVGPEGGILMITGEVAIKPFL